MNLNEIRKIVEKDKETSKLKVSASDLLIVYQYIQERDSKFTKNGYKIVLKTSPYIHTVFLPTKEKEKELVTSKKINKIKTLGTVNYIFKANLEDFEELNEERKRVKKKSIEFIDNYKNEKMLNGFYLYGQYKTGKTFLLSAIAQKLTEINASVVFVYFPDLVRILKSSLSDHTLEEKIITLKMCDVLMLDDFGAGNMSEWFRDEILGPILQYRLAASLPVFMSSNLNYQDLMLALAQGNEAEKVKAGRIVRRLTELMDDYSLSKDQFKNS